MSTLRIAALAACLSLASVHASALAQSDGPDPATPQAAAPAAALAPTATPTTGLAIYQRFREGLADPDCTSAPSTRWRQHFVSAPQKLASGRDDLLPLFGYVVDALREAGLPTEYALIPFVESGYNPAARSPSGPAGLWQMITITARNHKVPIRPGYDGRYSPIDSTRAAVRYLKTLHGMFAGDWRLAVMAYNAGEYRVLGALKRSGQAARNARPEQLALPDITQSYVRKLHALSCLMEQADDREEWLRSLDRPVARLEVVDVAEGATDLGAWARRNGHDPARLARLNPVFAGGRITRAGGQPAQLLVAATSTPPPVPAAASTSAAATITLGEAVRERAPAAPDVDPPLAKAAGDGTPAGGPLAAGERRHVVARGDNAWTIARRYGIGVADLLERNGLTPRSVLRPGTELRIDAAAGAP
ncbi:lytic transglycosylase domain-containing protein [Cognatilysobacter tabacisoli]|uniref:lytic transglycosylase domain-containing protein n=1 Tax=Cognatilysobacter tabacisoli TaxID=2315424 RepID=UPI000E6AF402|nr:lytic transglycosylase domain-containing protein [Lysobacter tabacisoli]